MGHRRHITSLECGGQRKHAGPSSDILRPCEQETMKPISALAAARRRRRRRRARVHARLDRRRLSEGFMGDPCSTMTTSGLQSEGPPTAFSSTSQWVRRRRGRLYSPNAGHVTCRVSQAGALRRCPPCPHCRSARQPSSFAMPSSFGRSPDVDLLPLDNAETLISDETDHRHRHIAESRLFTASCFSRYFCAFSFSILTYACACAWIRSDGPRGG